MDYPSKLDHYLTIIAKAADIIFRPFKYSAAYKNSDFEPASIDDDSIDFIISIMCRNNEGERLPKNDIELEVFRSGEKINIILCWPEKIELPILWHGEHSVWMNSITGERCQCPDNGSHLESFARRIKSLID